MLRKESSMAQPALMNLLLGGAFAGFLAIATLSLHAAETSNRLAANKLEANKLSSNKLSANRLSSYRYRATSSLPTGSKPFPIPPKFCRLPTDARYTAT